MSKKLILLIGAPGSGKTTDGKIVANECLSNITSYSLGEILKQDMQKGGKVGKIINDYVSKGELVPTSLTIDELCKTVLDAPTDIVLVDGFPREIEHVKTFGDVINNLNRVEILSVIEVKVSEETARERYFRNHNESEEVFNHSMKLYLDTIAEIENYYKEQNILKVIDGEKDLDSVVDDIKKYL
ncbi:MAG TPA: adenylate kinase, partial [Campylobacterales bacterium]|nr:adenylate kinase [Campylobacterales bacterium]